MQEQGAHWHALACAPFLIGRAGGVEINGQYAALAFGAEPQFRFLHRRYPRVVIASPLAICRAEISSTSSIMTKSHVAVVLNEAKHVVDCRATLRYRRLPKFVPGVNEYVNCSRGRNKLDAVPAISCPAARYPASYRERSSPSIGASTGIRIFCAIGNRANERVYSKRFRWKISTLGSNHTSSFFVPSLWSLQTEQYHAFWGSSRNGCVK